MTVPRNAWEINLVAVADDAELLPVLSEIKSDQRLWPAWAELADRANGPGFDADADTSLDNFEGWKREALAKATVAPIDPPAASDASLQSLHSKAADDVAPPTLEKT